MTPVLSLLRNLIFGDIRADSVVPPSGFTNQLTLFILGAMAFLAVFGLALSLASGRLATKWNDELARTATIRIIAPPDQLAGKTEAARKVLQTTSGVAEARALTGVEQQALLAPWLGHDLRLDLLPLPQLVEIISEKVGFDATGLRLRLSAEVPGAILDNHDRLRLPLLDAVCRMQLLGWGVLVLIFAVVAAMVTLGTNVSLAANAQVVNVLRLLGATDSYIKQAFVRRLTIKTFIGSTLGILLGLLTIWVMPSVDKSHGFLSGIDLQGEGWIISLLLPFVFGVVAFVATVNAANQVLRKIS